MKEKIVHRIMMKSGIPGIVNSLVEGLSFSGLKALLLNTFELKTLKKSYKDLPDKEFDYIDAEFTDRTAKLLDNKKSSHAIDFLARTMKLKI